MPSRRSITARRISAKTLQAYRQDLLSAGVELPGHRDWNQQVAEARPPLSASLKEDDTLTANFVNSAHGPKEKARSINLRNLRTLVAEMGSQVHLLASPG